MAEQTPSQPARGAALGLPADGPGSVAPMGRRVLGFLLDLVAGALIGGLINVVVPEPDALQRTLAVNGAFALEVIVLVALTGQSMGMRLAGIRVLRPASPGGVPGFLPAVVRTGLLMLVLPAVVTDQDNRGLHDRAAGTVVVRAG